MDFPDYSHYETLQVPHNASRETIKAAYNKLAKKFHPDKSQDPTDIEVFHKLQQAWEILRNDAQRCRYDQILIENKHRSSAVNYTDLDLDDLCYSSEGAQFTHACRCGEDLHVTEDDLEKGLEFFECEGCSLVYHILYEVCDS